MHWHKINRMINRMIQVADMIRPNVRVRVRLVLSAMEELICPVGRLYFSFLHKESWAHTHTPECCVQRTKNCVLLSTGQTATGLRRSLHFHVQLATSPSASAFAFQGAGLTPKRGWGLLQVDGVATVVAISGCQVRLMIKEGAKLWGLPSQFVFLVALVQGDGMLSMRPPATSFWRKCDTFWSWLFDLHLHQVFGVASSMSWRQGNAEVLKHVKTKSILLLFDKWQLAGNTRACRWSMKVQIQLKMPSLALKMARHLKSRWHRTSAKHGNSWSGEMEKWSGKSCHVKSYCGLSCNGWWSFCSDPDRSVNSTVYSDLLLCRFPSERWSLLRCPMVLDLPIRWWFAWGCMLFWSS